MGILGFIVMIVLIVVGFFETGYPTAFLDLGSALITLGLLCAALLMSFGMGGLKAVRTVFSRSADREALVLGIAVFERGKSCAVGAGVLGTLVGVVIMLGNFDKVSALGPGLALALLTQAYGLLLAYGIFLPVAASLKRRLEEITV